MESTEFTLEDCTRLWEIDTSGCCGKENREMSLDLRELILYIFIGVFVYVCVSPLTCLLKILSSRLRLGGSGG